MIEEYKSLRRELLQLAASISRWQLVGFVSAGVAIAVALVTGGWVTAAAGLVVIAGCIFGIIHDLTSILRIAAYIQTFHEGRDTGLLWETRLEGIRDAHIFAPLRGYMTPILSLLWVGLLCSLVAGLLPLFVSPYIEPQIWPLAFIVVWLIFWGFMRPSYLAFGKDGFKEETRQAFLDSLRRQDDK